MGQLNQPSNLVDRVSKLERALEAFRKLSGLTSAIIRRGGITLLDDSFLKMVDDQGTRILYIGPNSEGKQVFALRRENGSLVLQSDYFAGEPFFAMRDQNDVILFSDNAAGSGGMARPWLPIPMYPKFVCESDVSPNPELGFTYGYMFIDNSRLASETTLWEGRASVLHKFVELRTTTGRAIGGAHVPRYRLKFNGTTVGEWTDTGLSNLVRGPYDISQWLDQNDVSVQLTCSLDTGGAGSTACQITSVYMRQ
ncbi:hypothetical protein SAMN04489729_4802 [Amycolatopsis lurida]|uniref:Uncharacterized protein n=1 Tax=Amycolatopsis lurida NRRL 2430 TaxID=1460371 RepID=A0A2P2FWD5_AMYLU|nr:hypothetical protein [Amycolatopsis lurida]KFU81023.1 hypothetical protein BB31_11620 [Amycolatopsis lurida NRRL 2430]SED60044.1 hypothetical protein SAMN04489729_4802 [Amycolatopsis lurida]